MLRTFWSLAEVSKAGEGEAYQWLSLKISHVTSSRTSYFIDNFSLTSSIQVLQYRNKIIYSLV